MPDWEFCWRAVCISHSYSWQTSRITSWFLGPEVIWDGPSLGFRLWAFGFVWQLCSYGIANIRSIGEAFHIPFSPQALSQLWSHLPLFQQVPIRPQSPERSFSTPWCQVAYVSPLESQKSPRFLACVSLPPSFLSMRLHIYSRVYFAFSEKL